jgi:cytochrome c peroxidase
MWPCRLIPCCYLAALFILVAAGCEPARKYPVATTKPSAQPSEDATQPRLPPEFAWQDPGPSLDIPIRFVDSASRPDEWKNLREFWTHEGGGVGGQRTAHLGLPPMQAVLALRASAEYEVIQIKVPLGLPDPTPNIPAVNPPTHGKWRLGKILFFDRELLQGPDSRRIACADCHRPVDAFTERRAVARHAFFNVPSLMNCVYNRHQFWDGRATTLEEAIQRTLEDDAAPAVVVKPEQAPEARHAWSGVIARLRDSSRYRQEFARVFGTPPTLDNAAKALATYLRTILSGNSIYDRAAANRAARKGDTLQAADFRAALDDNTILALAGPSLTGQQTAAALVRGHALLHGKARCAVCHGGPLFTDHDFHNVGIGESDSLDGLVAGRERGRFRRLPAGLKDRRYIGAFKTPTLRGLPRTAPFMHNGSVETLEHVLDYFNAGMRPFHSHLLDPELRSGSEPWHPGLTPAEIRDLLMFLKSLNGEPVAAVVAQP